VRLRAVLISTAILLASGCAERHAGVVRSTAQWRDTSAGAVSRPIVGYGVAAATALRPDGRLQTIADDVTTGQRLWARSAAMAGRPIGLGVGAPAISGTATRPVVASVEPRASGAALVGRDAHSGARRWTRPLRATLGAVRCGEAFCLSESTPRGAVGFTAIDATTGRPRWRSPGIAEVEWADPRRVVVLRIAVHPAIEALDPRTGHRIWRLPVAGALGPGTNLTGGWIFGSLGDSLVGYVAPPRIRRGGYGFFAVGLADGRTRWTRPHQLRVYPSANPAVALFTRTIDARGHYGEFQQLDPRTGRAVARIPAAGTPRTGWWLALPADLSSVGFLSAGHPGRAYELRTGRPIAGHVQGWSFCGTTPSPLKINGRRGFYPIAAVCPYDLKSGKRMDSGTPPGWYTGAADGWRVWRDQHGGLHGVHDARGTTPGMYG
jgi:outer membrane protein assembly factor BamB